MFILWIVAALISIFVLLFCLPVELKIQFTRNSGDDEGFIQVRYLFGLIRWQKRITKVEAKMASTGPTIQAAHHTERSPLVAKVSKADDSKSADGTRIKLDDVWKFLKRLPDLVDLYQEVAPVLRRLMSRVAISTLRCHVRVGTGDVVTAGLVTGTVWALISGSLGKLSYMCRCQCAPDIRVDCDFNTARLELSFDCIMRVRAGYAIKAGLRLIPVWRRRETHGAPHPRFDANSHDEHSRNG